MLIRKPILERIKAGDVSLAFRRWQRPAVNQGSTFKTTVGVLSVQRVEKIPLKSISESDARNAGYPNLNSLLTDLNRFEGPVYRIELAYVGDDPRVALRQDDDLTANDLDDLVRRLQRMDARSKTGDWTRTVLLIIEAHPMTAAAELAVRTGFKKDWLKLNVRKLKNLGLTISHQPGYELSPRGIVVLNHLKKNA